MDFPSATCKKHGTSLELKRYTTFCYWWCSKCNDEPDDVSLNVVHWSRAERYGAYHVKADNDIILRGDGIWKLTYTDGSFEFYEKLAGSRDTTLLGEQIQSAVRLADGSVPSRKPVQLSSEASAGGSPQGQGLRAVPDAPDSGTGCLPFYYDTAAGSDGDSVVYSTITRSYSRAFLDPSGSYRLYTPITEAEARALAGPNFPLTLLASFGSGTNITLPLNFKFAVQGVAKCRTSLQYRQVPPDDEW